MKYYSNIDLSKNQIQNGVYHKLASAPASPVAGQFYYNTTDNKLYYYNGTSWKSGGTDTQTTNIHNCYLPDSL